MLGAGHMLKVNAVGFPDSWDVECERKRKVEDDFRDFGLSNGTMGLISAEMRKAMSGAGFGGRLGIQL